MKGVRYNYVHIFMHHLVVRFSADVVSFFSVHCSASLVIAFNYFLINQVYVANV